MGSAVKIRRTIEWDADGLPSWLQNAVAQSGKPVTKFCKEVGISTQFYYSVVRGEASSIKAETLEKIEEVLGEKYPDWSESPTPPQTSSKRRRGGVAVSAVKSEANIQEIPNGHE